MANTFKNKGATNVGTSGVTLYVTPSSTATTILGLTVANVTTSSITTSVTVYDASASTYYHIVKNAPVLAGGSLVVVGGDQKIVLEASDQVVLSTSASNSGDAFMSYLETT